MRTDITRMQTPEEAELARKKAELASLEAELVQRELALTTIQIELNTFERRYLSIVGVRYAELDEIEAQIAEVLADLNPNSENMRERAATARTQAQETAQAAGSVKEAKHHTKFIPSETLKNLYREVAKRVHPDLTTDEKERARRTKLMAEANQAYAEGDEARLQAILQDWESSPESVKGEGPGAELVRIIRKIAQVALRLRVIAAEIEALLNSDLHLLNIKVEEAEVEGRDLLAEMAGRVDSEVADARDRLAELLPRRTSK